MVSKPNHILDSELQQVNEQLAQLTATINTIREQLGKGDAVDLEPLVDRMNSLEEDLVELKENVAYAEDNITELQDQIGIVEEHSERLDSLEDHIHSIEDLDERYGVLIEKLEKHFPQLFKDETPNA